MSNELIDEAVELFEKGFNATRDSQEHIEAAVVFLKNHEDVFENTAKIRELSALLVSKGYMSDLLLTGLSDELRTKEFEEIGKAELETIYSAASDEVTRLAAIAAHNILEDDDTFDLRDLEKRKEAQIADSLLHMFPSKREWVDFCGFTSGAEIWDAFTKLHWRELYDRGGGFTRSELFEELANQSWPERERKVFFDLLTYWNKFDSDNAIEYEDIQNVINDRLAYLPDHKLERQARRA